MGRSILVAVLAAAGLLALPAGTMAQQSPQTPRDYAPPLVGAEPPPETAPVYGAPTRGLHACEPHFFSSSVKSKVGGTSNSPSSK